jgi:hypothetical protein
LADYLDDNRRIQDIANPGQVNSAVPNNGDRDMKFSDPTPVITRSIQRMVCTGCGAEANASCNCGKAYMPKAVRAAEAVAANPEKSDRAIAAEIGVSGETVRQARKQLPSDLAVVERIGLDGKTRKQPAKKSTPTQEMPTAEEAEESHQETLYDQACLFLELMTDETRRRFKVTEAERELAAAAGGLLPATRSAMSGRALPLRHASGDDLAYLEKLIEADELRSEAHRREGRIQSASELMQRTRYLRQLCPPTSRVHKRVWGCGDMFPAQVAS